MGQLELKEQTLPRCTTRRWPRKWIAPYGQQVPSGIYQHCVPIGTRIQQEPTPRRSQRNHIGMEWNKDRINAHEKQCMRHDIWGRKMTDTETTPKSTATHKDANTKEHTTLLSGIFVIEERRQSREWVYVKLSDVGITWLDMTACQVPPTFAGAEKECPF